MPPAPTFPPFDLTKITPRPYQQQVLDLVFGPKAGDDKLYVVSPPGSGKTILGLIVALRMEVPTLVLAPNTAIQSQWVAKAGFFETDPESPLATTNLDSPAPIVVLTYQALARPASMDDVQEEELVQEWLAELTGGDEEDQGELPGVGTEDLMDEEAAGRWLRQFETQNPERYRTALLGRWKRKRLASEDSDVDILLDETAQAVVETLSQREIGLVIFDECHHLVGYWAQVVGAVREALQRPRILALTATPPGKERLSNVEIQLHKELLGDVDYAMPTPAIVRDGNLAPYQDLVHFTRPRSEELTYIADCSGRLHEVLEMVEEPGRARLSDWLLSELNAIPEHRLAGELRRRQRFFEEAVNYLRSRGYAAPERIVAACSDDETTLEQQADLVGRFASRALLISQNEEERALFDQLATAFRPLGYQLTPKGLRRCQSTVSRVLALSESKLDGLRDLLHAEMDATLDTIRAVIITDFEKSSATIDKDVAHLLTEESGGAVAVMRMLTSDPRTDELDPILVTGQTVLVDDDLLPRFEAEAAAWFQERGLRAELAPKQDGGFYRIDGAGRDWTTRHYVMMVTDLFERGITRCLVGTRGLLGEGWDALCANTLVDLTTAATEMTVNQLRGRAIRLDPKTPKKVSNIWDVVCLAPEFEKGLSDYHRLARKHSGYYGLCDDGAIEYGLGHIHPALTEAGPEDVALNAHVLNAEMLARARGRKEIYRDWQVGTPYDNITIPSLELKADGLFGEFGFRGNRPHRIEVGKMLKAICQAVTEGLTELGRFEDRRAKLVVNARADGYFRIYLNSKHSQDMVLFAQCITELFQPIESQRYIIPRFEQMREHTWFSRLLPEIVGQYLRRKRLEVAVYHPLPEVFGSAKEHAELFSDRWNRRVSTGRAVYTKRGQGEEIVVQAKPKSQSVMAARSKLKSVWR
ncbi:MAG: DEAD/DEAH box helicase family protein [Lentisphaerae bacterium]|jgi:superfamily II DNA or RNA helicase|nr:DEAD/DEAH box helicase family protein [Lentisphaerota bacterium]MBT4814485.1 DEAD/DEAH box helicase family protein [Lentisphaerota bacterium]MBT5607304.1 DEAD/DEAH box helicase family protein [Lentisphaerota bacterium]MBT7055378.1 DEAD/DEAH box helicase family protein [Lentisphaerota bacterium]MBT7840976.1 DEAD/DEAH box helicase family protein [Lentisphaerota bacterium]